MQCIAFNFEYNWQCNGLHLVLDVHYYLIFWLLLSYSYFFCRVAINCITKLSSYCKHVFLGSELETNRFSDDSDDSDEERDNIQSEQEEEIQEPHVSRHRKIVTSSKLIHSIDYALDPIITAR